MKIKKPKLLKKTTAFTLVFIFVFSTLLQTFDDKASAAPPENPLLQIGTFCHHMKKGEKPWDDCDKWQGLTDVLLECGNLFYDSPDVPGEWYTDIDNYALCHAKAKTKLDLIGSKKCKSVKNKTDDWKNCEEAQLALETGLGCSGNMFHRTNEPGVDPDDDFFQRIEGRYDDCKKRLADVAGLTLYKSDGTLADDKVGKLSEAQQGDEKKEDDTLTDCDTKLTNPLSWIICPLIDLGSNMSDAIFQDVAKPLLSNVPVSTKRSDPIYQAWQGFRFIANIMLIGSMLAIVYAQARGEK